MSRDSKRSANERLKYGICLNDECSMCKSKEIQSVPMRKDLLCSECGKELRECPPPKKKNSKKPLYISDGKALELLKSSTTMRPMCILVVLGI